MAQEITTGTGLTLAGGILSASGGGGSSDFLGLTDTPNSYTGQAGKGVVVNGAATGLDFTTAATGSYDLGLTWSGTLPASQVLLRYPFPRAVTSRLASRARRDGPRWPRPRSPRSISARMAPRGYVQFAAAAPTATFTMASAASCAVGDILTVHAPASADATLADLGLSLAGTRAVVTGEMGATTWLGLTDTPDAYPGQAGKVVRVNACATATEYGPALGTMAQQDAGAWRLRGGVAAFSTLDVALDSILRSGMQVPDKGGDNVTALYSTLNDAGGTNRWYFYSAGTVPSFHRGNLYVENRVAIGANATPDAYLRVLYPRQTYYGLKIQPSDNDTGVGSAVLFADQAGAQVGSIHTTASATAYNTSSDVRLKHAIAPLTGALDKVQALRPVAFRWNADDSRGHGFLAHELQREIPDAVTGQPDEVNPDGTIKPQQVDHSRLVVWLVAGMQELLAQVQTLTAQVASLEQQRGV